MRREEETTDVVAVSARLVCTLAVFERCAARARRGEVARECELAARLEIFGEFDHVVNCRLGVRREFMHAKRGDVRFSFPPEKNL